MSIHIYTLSDSPLLSISEWQRLIDAAGFPLQLPTDAPLDESGGSIVAQLRGKPAPLEYRFEDAKELMDLYSDVNFGHDWKYVLALPWIHGFAGLNAAWMAATSYARSTGGIVFDPQERKLLNSDEALQVVHDMERTGPQAEAALQDFLGQLAPKS